MFAAEHGGDDSRQRRSAEYTLHGRGSSDRRADIVLEEVLDAAALLEPRPYVVLRLHPKNSREEFARYLNEVDLVSEGGDPIELIWASDLVVGLSSILLMEAAVAGRPTLSVVPREAERVWSPSVMEELTPCVTTRKALRAMVGAKNVTSRRQDEGDSVSKVAAVILDRLEQHPAA
jgi:predicted glycosyltransferase